MKKLLCIVLCLVMCLGLSAPAALAEDAPLTIDMIIPLYSDAPSLDDAFWTAWQELCGAKLNVEWVPSSDFHTKYNLKLSSGDIPEVSSVPDVRTAPLINAIKEGAFWDLTDFLGDFSRYPNLLQNQVEGAYKYLTVDGRIYGLPRSRTRIDNGLKIRKDWLDKCGLAVPTTLEEYREALKIICQSDCDGNGLNDTIGLIATGSTTSIPVSPFLCAYGALDAQFDADGGYIATQLNDGTLEAVDYLRSLYADGTLAQEFPAIKSAQAIELFTSGAGASYLRSIWWDYDWEQTMKKTDENAQIINLTLQGPVHAAVELNTGVSGGFYISKKVPEEKVLKILDYFEKSASVEAYDLAYFGVEGVHHTVEPDGAKKMTELGSKEINVTSKGAGVLNYGKWAKVDAANGTKAYNEAKRAEVADFDEIGSVVFMSHALSDTWTQIWPMYEEEYTSMATKAIFGQISMDELRAYVLELRELPEMKQAFQELAAYYNELNP